jgi:glucose-6-phosphate isomerase
MPSFLEVNSSLDIQQKGDWQSLIQEAESCRQQILRKNGIGNNFLGWVALPGNFMSSGILEQIAATAKEIQENSKVLVAIGIGGSYLGARAVIEALKGYYSDLEILSGAKSGTVVRYAGHHLNGDELMELMDILKTRDFSLNVISKSGTTTEPGLAFRILRNFLNEKYGNQAARRIIATTDQAKGALKKLADAEKYRSFVIPDDVGGRYSVFTPVGLLPIAVAGIDIHELIAGAHEAEQQLTSQSSEANAAILYAALRNYFYRKGLGMEVLISYQAKTSMVGEWWKQLFGESEGKEGKGLWPATAQFTTDLHSLGQWLQEGPRTFFETLIQWESNSDLEIPRDHDNLDGFNFIAGKSLSYVNKMALQGTMEAHRAGGVEMISIQPGTLNARNLGRLLYFFQFSCAVSGYMLGINPFDQPGVEAYKKNMFRLLGKPGA